MGVTYQTVRLSRGNHKSPAEGVCVMELASMLAEEPFSDHPTTACPVVAALLRTINDALDDEPRQELYAYAAKAVGSRGSRGVEQARMDRLVAWTEELEGRRRTRPRVVASKYLGWLAPRPPAHLVAARAVRAIAGRSGDARRDALSFVDELLGFGGRPPVVAPPSDWSGSAPPQELRGSQRPARSAGPAAGAE